MSIPELLDNVLAAAIEARASDVHLEPFHESSDARQVTRVRVRFRIDGLLYQMGESFESAIGAALISRLKVLANLNSADKRIPQDGALAIDSLGTYDIRVATFPSIHGEKVVLRLLDRTGKAKELSELGLSSLFYHRLETICRFSQGFFLVTGPTGSGKTTTLHAMLARSTSPEKNVVTLEDPVEYSMPGITQTQISPGIGFTFERALRSLLRQDPDIIMLGEIRDRETAHIAIQAALTGHLLFSTLHTADAPQALLRLLDMGVEPFLLTAALKALLAQRLARRLCEQCRYERELIPEERTTAHHLGLRLDRTWTASGCSDCCGTGYKGRIGIFQLMEMTPALIELTMQRPSYDKLSSFALSEGMKPLSHDGLDKVHSGTISFSELVRVVY